MRILFLIVASYLYREVCGFMDFHRKMIQRNRLHMVPNSNILIPKSSLIPLKSYASSTLQSKNKMDTKNQILDVLTIQPSLEEMINRTESRSLHDFEVPRLYNYNSVNQAKNVESNSGFSELLELESIRYAFESQYNYPDDEFDLVEDILIDSKGFENEINAAALKRNSETATHLSSASVTSIKRTKSYGLSSGYIRELKHLTEDKLSLITSSEKVVETLETKHQPLQPLQLVHDNSISIQSSTSTTHTQIPDLEILKRISVSSTESLLSKMSVDEIENILNTKSSSDVALLTTNTLLMATHSLITLASRYVQLYLIIINLF